MIVGLCMGMRMKSVNGTVQRFMNLLDLIWEKKLSDSQLIIVGGPL